MHEARYVGGDYHLGPPGMLVKNAAGRRAKCLCSFRYVLFSLCLVQRHVVRAIIVISALFMSMRTRSEYYDG